MDDILEQLKSLVTELENDNRETLETIESLQMGLEESERENEQLRNRVNDLEMQLRREPETAPMFPPFSMQAELDEMIKQMGRDNFGFRGGKRP